MINKAHYGSANEQHNMMLNIKLTIKDRINFNGTSRSTRKVVLISKTKNFRMNFRVAISAMMKFFYQ